MRTNDDIEGYLIELDKPFEELDEGLWRLSNEDDHIDSMLIMHTPPIIVFRVKLMETPEGARRIELYEDLLKLNANNMIAGAYGIEDDSVVIVDTLQAENLDYNEFQASVESISMAIAEDYPQLSAYRTEHADGDATASSAE